MPRLLVSLMIIMGSLLPAAAPSTSDAYIVFAWNGSLFANSVQTGVVTELGPVWTDFSTALPGYDVYTLVAAPLTELPSDGYGFHHGIWSPDRTRFAYLEIAPPHYRVRMQTMGGDNQLLLDGELSPVRGYLDPIGWTAQGELVLLERMLLNHWHTGHIWRLDPATLTLNYHALVPLDRLSGRSALLPDAATVFLGYNVDQQVGYLLDLASGQARLFSAQLGLPPGHELSITPCRCSARSTPMIWRLSPRRHRRFISRLKVRFCRRLFCTGRFLTTRAASPAILIRRGRPPTLR